MIQNNTITHNDKQKTIIMPCSGIGKALGTITRWTAYEITQNLKPETSQLLCLARLVVADDETKQIVSTHPIITIDGCPKKCATLNVERNGGIVTQSYLMAKFLGKNRDLTLGKDITNPGKDGLELAKRTAQEIAEIIE